MLLDRASSNESEAERAEQIRQIEQVVWGGEREGSTVLTFATARYRTTAGLLTGQKRQVVGRAVGLGTEVNQVIWFVLGREWKV